MKVRKRFNESDTRRRGTKNQFGWDRYIHCRLKFGTPDERYVFTNHNQ